MHKTVMHGAVCETLTHIRQTYWLPQGWQLVERTISKCVTCRKIQGPPFRSVPTPPLPKSRVLQSQAFQLSGIDYTGSLIVRDQGYRTSSNVYISLFTCAAVRALHLELIEDQTTQAFLRAFRRFISGRGVPECIISDNARTFKAGAQELQTMKNQVLKPNASQQFLANHNITWKFITERAPWWEGLCERLVGLVERCLKKHRQSLSEQDWTKYNTHWGRGSVKQPSLDISLRGYILTWILCGHRLLTLPDTRVSVKESDPDYIPTDVSTK